MANPPSSAPNPVTPDAFLADRQGMWSAFVSFATGCAVAVAIVLALMGFFLL